MKKYRDDQESEKSPLEITQDVERHLNFAYLRDRDRHRRGVLVVHADPSSEVIRLAMSICMPDDNFDPRMGYELAKKRLERGDSVDVEIGDLRYVLSAAGVRENNGAYQLLGEMRSYEIVELLEAVVNQTGVTQEGWDSLGISLMDHATTLANVVKWAMQGEAVPWSTSKK